MKKLTLLLAVVLGFQAMAQEKDPVLLTIDKKEVKLSEFEAIFKKNNNDEPITKEAVSEYLDLYVKFKLKVREAEVLGYDTTKAFKNELEGYRKQLIQPYLSDREVTESLIKEAYERMKHDVRASHILFNVGKDALPKDTLAVYKRAMAARKKVMGGADFAKVAQDLSQDPSAKTNKGDLGFFSALHMVYPFETAAFNQKVGEVSMPVRTRFGYHIIKVTDKRESRGTIRVGHIMVACAKDADEAKVVKQKAKAEELYAQLREDPQKFRGLAKQYSDDKGSASRGGELAPFGAGRMVPEFENAAFALKADGMISSPVRTEFGFHIIQRLELKGLDTYENLYANVKSKVSRDSRANKSKDVVVDRIKKENGFKENLKARDAFFSRITADQWMKGAWTNDLARGLNKFLFGFYTADGDKLEVMQNEFADYLMTNQPKNSRSKKKVVVEEEVNRLYTKMVEERALKFKEDRLPKVNQEYRLLLQEYRDGILLFELTDEKVWSKAIKDTTGLEKFHEGQKDKYMWGERLDVTAYKCADDATVAKLEKILKKKAKKGYTVEDILGMINTEEVMSLSIENGKYEKGKVEMVDDLTWEKGFTKKENTEEGTTIWVVNEVVKPEPKLLSEVRGLATSDYQTHLEKEWVKELKAKYDVQVNKEVLELVK